MEASRRLVVAAFLAIWFFPAVSQAEACSAADPAPLPALVTSSHADVGTTGSGATRAEASDLAARERQARDLQDFKGGYAVVYIGSGALLVLVIVLLILLV